MDWTQVNIKLDLIQKDTSLLKTELTYIKTEIAVLKAVMIMKNIMPDELAYKEEVK